MITYIDNAKAVLKHAYSMWAAYAAALFMAITLAGPQIAIALPLLQPLLSERVFAWLSFILVGLIPFLRTVKQEKVAIEQGTKTLDPDTNFPFPPSKQ